MKGAARVNAVRRSVAAMVIAGALVGAPLTAGAAVAAPAISASDVRAIVPAAKPPITTFKNCTALNKSYKGGVARSGVTHNTVNGKKKPFKVKPYISTALYNANKKMDRDKDGIACEKG
ncbi:excalibur calcium-binding domain-containing protein [Microbacterium oleivorans]|uniref:excalibur calcium-binding domain-containing protein n=1 Tax=Microbacterium oleivorans TaxID=273677 RepID=UPI0020404AFD|nr:excalibur calcium-binding domain-containing protein [Microbacterium oleivorans]MCM3696832.1 excalibur calcium-binding domain-containing protein [Microbacterium oleivorans]